MTRLSHTCSRLALAALWGALVPSVAYASGDAGFTFTIHGYYLIDFAVFLGILIWFGRKPIAAALDGRYKSVVEDMEAAAEVRRKAQERYDEYTARMERLETELGELLAEVREGTQRECDRILQEAKDSADRIAAEEAARVAQEGKKIREELAEAAVNAAIELASQRLVTKLTAETQSALTDKIIADMSSVDNAEVQA